MRIACLIESGPDERRAAITPESARTLAALDGVQVCVESGTGLGIHVADAAFAEAEAEIAPTPAAAMDGADVLLRVGPPIDAEFDLLPPGLVRIGFLDVFTRTDDVRRLAEAGVTAASMELLPRTTLAQPMDALSSQHSLAGYAMAVLAADRLDRVFPMMVTPSGTLKPATVLVIGAGVAGLQAIATAKRLGARVEAFDTRAATKEQVESLGGRFVEIDLGPGEDAETAGGYARELTTEQKERQQAGLARAVARADVVITTAAVFGRPAPRIVTADMVAAMRPGAVVVDYAAASGGNVDGTAAGQEIVTDGGVRIIGQWNYPGLVARDASTMYASNLAAVVARYHAGPDAPARGSDDDDGATSATGAPARCTLADAAAAGDEIAAGIVVTHAGEIVHPLVRERLGLPPQPSRDDDPRTAPDGAADDGGASDPDAGAGA